MLLKGSLAAEAFMKRATGQEGVALAFASYMCPMLLDATGESVGVYGRIGEAMPYAAAPLEQLLQKH